MMTTMAALVGTLPIALGWGAGAEARRPLGLAVVGGLVVSQTLTLYITPVFYLYMEALSARLRGHRAPIAVKFDRAALMANGRTHAEVARSFHRERLSTPGSTRRAAPSSVRGDSAGRAAAPRVAGARA